MATISISGPHPKQSIKLRLGKLLIIKGGSWKDYSILANEDLKVEFIEDRIYIQSPASLVHEEIFGYLLTELRIFLKKKAIGKILGSRFPIEIDTERRVEPDLLFLSNEDIKTGNLSKTVFTGEPSWIIEIVSPSYREHDTITKRELYKNIGVKEYWIIDPEYKSIEIIRYKNHEIAFEEIFTKGEIKPDIPSFDTFKIEITEFWGNFKTKD